ncbi:hypothetical protein WICMUC_005784 [Wickerhamomyces mucosus]|uniref:Uncharacterized protein n=1 Tax=Wickerhamomyces mucosus TaxID=1378264 RepID=A0A9P8T3P2_9ASCO|nr:hypothetical protein WICMUC_005784 [Wickerhamomyces mucosus]
MFSVSSTVAIYLRCCFLLAVVFYLFRDPKTVVDQPFMLVVYQALEIPHCEINRELDETFNLGLFFIFNLSFTDFVQLAVRNNVYFDSIVPVRLVLFFGLAFWIYSYKTANDLIFLYCFIEIWFNFFIYNSLKQERYERIKRLEKSVEAKLLEIQQSNKDHSEELQKLFPKLERTNDI